ncbi:MAG: glutamate-1-semialdehyde 2,1-aminomutase [Candidatus Dormibacteraeota bacterium]|nr:glutamate-1-semialdehyde 2,1-aminomutase [Candidatus Dormibacteraeota bacterium]
MSDSADRALQERAERVMPGGVSSPVRAYRATGGVPPVIASGEGAYVVDSGGRRYVDHVLAYGPHILGHNPPAVVQAVRAQLDHGIAFGATTEVEIGLAERIVAAVASIDMVRFVNSGTEAAMSAVRLARAATRRDLVVKFAGGYHGHADALLAAAGSGVATLGLPGSPGVPAAAVAATLVLPYNDTAAVEDLFARRGEQVAAVIVEPVAGNMGCVPPVAGFLPTLRRVTAASGSLLIFDEVMTGFRLAYGGAQSLFDIRPDLTCLGKVIGGGLAVAAYGGRRDLMELVAPSGPVYQAGTLSGSPPAMAAGCAVLDALAGGAAYARLEKLGRRIEAAFSGALGESGVAGSVNRVGSMVTPFIGVTEVRDLAGAQRADTTAFAQVHRAWLDAGVFWPPSQFEAGFLCTAHTDSDVDRTAAAFAGALTRLSASLPGGAAAR